MAKRSKGVIYSDVFENRNLDIAGILRKCVRIFFTKYLVTIVVIVL